VPLLIEATSIQLSGNEGGKLGHMLGTSRNGGDSLDEPQSVTERYERLEAVFGAKL